MHPAVLPLSAVRLDAIQSTIVDALYRRTERWHEVDDLARKVFPAASAYPAAELRAFVLPRLRRLASLGIVRLRGKLAAISLEGIDFIEQLPGRTKASA
jgi:hypothetical protein